MRKRCNTAARPWLILLAATVLLLASLAAQARVFARWSGRGDLARTLTTLGGRLVYESRITLNGGDGDLQVFDLEQPLGEVAAELHRVLAADDLVHAGGSLLCATLQDSAQVLRLVLAQPDPLGHTVVFALRQTPDEFAHSTSSAAIPTLDTLPAHPGATPRFYAEDQRTGTRFGLADVNESAADVRAFYEAQLTAAGWQSLTPAPTAGSTGLQTYTRDRDLCFVLAADSPTGGGATITLLHKRLGLK